LGGKIKGGLIPPLVISLKPIKTFELVENNMTQIKIDKMLESTGGNFLTLERITPDKRAPTEIRLTALLALNEKHKEYPVQVFDQTVESRNQKISLDINN
jgi:hypothetical protein